MKLSFRHGLGFAAAIAVQASPLLATPADTIRGRVAAYRDLGAAFKGVNDTLRGGEVQTIVLGQYARQIRNVSRQQYGWFSADTGPQPGVKTKALPAIWARPVQFKAAQDAFGRGADDFQRAVTSGDMATIRKAARTLGGACKGCHDQFRDPRE